MSAHIPHVHVPWHHPHHPPSEKRLLDGVDIANPLHSGYMYKEAHSHLVFHKRFFVLFPRVLVYYEKESEYKKDVARGTLEVRSTCSVHDVRLATLRGEGVKRCINRVSPAYILCNLSQF